MCPEDYDDRYLPSRLVSAADVASDIWEPIAKTLITHVPGPETNNLMCTYCKICGEAFPCEDWRRARDQVLGNE